MQLFYYVCAVIVSSFAVVASVAVVEHVTCDCKSGEKIIGSIHHCEITSFSPTIRSFSSSTSPSSEYSCCQLHPSTQFSSDSSLTTQPLSPSLMASTFQPPCRPTFLVAQCRTYDLRAETQDLELPAYSALVLLLTICVVLCIYYFVSTLYQQFVVDIAQRVCRLCRHFWNTVCSFVSDQLQPFGPSPHSALAPYTLLDTCTCTTVCSSTQEYVYCRVPPSCHPPDCLSALPRPLHYQQYHPPPSPPPSSPSHHNHSISPSHTSQTSSSADAHMYPLPPTPPQAVLSRPASTISLRSVSSSPHLSSAAIVDMLHDMKSMMERMMTILEEKRISHVPSGNNLPQQVSDYPSTGRGDEIEEGCFVMRVRRNDDAHERLQPLLGDAVTIQTVGAPSETSNGASALPVEHHCARSVSTSTDTIMPSPPRGEIRVKKSEEEKVRSILTQLDQTDHRPLGGIISERITSNGVLDNPYDMAACPINQCLYITEKTGAIYRIDVTDKTVSKLRLQHGDADGFAEEGAAGPVGSNLSMYRHRTVAVTTDGSLIIVQKEKRPRTSKETDTIKEYSGQVWYYMLRIVLYVPDSQDRSLFISSRMTYVPADRCNKDVHHVIQASLDTEPIHYLVNSAGNQVYYVSSVGTLLAESVEEESTELGEREEGALKGHLVRDESGVGWVWVVDGERVRLLGKDLREIPIDRTLMSIPQPTRSEYGLNHLV